MKTKKIELDVDFIGGQGSLTIDEEKALSEFFKQRKLQNAKSVSTTKKSTQPAKRLKSIA
jgi:hypothetical protein